MPTPGNTAPTDEPAHGQQTTPSSLIGGLSVLGVAALALGTWLAIRYAVRLTPAVLLSIGAVATGLGALIAATIVSVIAPRSVADETASIMGSLEAIARGDLTRDPTPGSGLGPVGLALRRALAALRTSHGEVRRHAGETATRADELATQLAATHVAAQRSGELAVGVSERGHALARVGEQLQAEVTTLAESIDLWSHRQRADVADRMTGREQLSEITRDLHTAVETLEALGARGSVATMHLERIDESVDKIREFVSLVRKMARQSKLLSLNAAMEAARAGEQGSGFAVVAAEVRRLAKGSSDAADRTEAMLKDLLRDAGLAREAAAASQVLVAQSAVAVTRARDQVAVPAPSADPAPTPPNLNLTSVKTNVGQLALDTEGLAKLASDAKLTQGATLTRLHDLIAAAHSLNRSAARTATGVDTVRAESGDAERKTEQPASLSLTPEPHAR